MTTLGIDIGGSGIKAAPVDLTTGELVSDRKRIKTPQPATPAAVADTVKKLVKHFDWDGPVGAAFPARIAHGVAKTASNIEQEFIGLDVEQLFSEMTDLPFVVLNDADAAGIGEAQFGAGKGEKGITMMLTFGTGIGTGLMIDGVLVPGTELGHVVLPSGKVAEPFAADSARKEHDLSWKDWGDRVQMYLEHIEFLFAPDVIVIGGGVSKPERWEKFSDRLSTTAALRRAELGNNAGIVGAALAAGRQKGFGAS
jgi:polyphosphate glucokinase